MNKFLFICLSTLSFFTLSFSGYSSNRYAILIGIGKYLPYGNLTQDQNPRHIINLKAPVIDVTSMRSVLENKFSFSKTNVFTLLDSQATKEHIFNLMDSVSKIMKPEDHLFFYYSGHGSHVHNSKSTRSDKMEETIVPADVLKLHEANPNALADIRGKELAHYFNIYLAKGAHVTAVFDCCHSGSMTRGINELRDKRILPSAIDAADGSQEKAPVDNGALIFSAAQADQVSQEKDYKELNISHSLFTEAFLKAVAKSGRNVTSNELFLQTKALLNGAGYRQEPDLEGDVFHKNAPLFLSSDELQADKIQTLEIPLLKTESNGSMLLDGGLLSGLDSGDVVTIVNSKIPCKLRIVSLDGLNRSSAVACTGNTATPKSGDLFILDKKCKAPPVVLNVFVPFSNYSFTALKDLSKRVKTIGTPSENELLSGTQTTMIWFDKSKWHLTRKATLTDIKQSTSFDSLVASANEKYLICLPLYDSLAAWLRKSINGNSTIHLTDIEHADYMLAGIPSADSISYQWINIFESPGSQNMFPASFPPVAVRETNTNKREIAYELTLQAKNIYKAKKWINIQAPTDGNNFPYHFCFIKNKSGNKPETLLTNQVMADGDSITIALQLDTLKKQTWDNKRMYMYLYSYDACFGEIGLLYPQQTVSENRYPLSNDDKIEWKSYIRPLEHFTVDASSFGNMMFFAICSESALPDPHALETQQSITATRGISGEDVLDFFQSNTSTRGIASGNNWSIDKQVFTTVPKEQNLETH